MDSTRSSLPTFSYGVIFWRTAPVRSGLQTSRNLMSRVNCLQQFINILTYLLVFYLSISIWLIIAPCFLLPYCPRRQPLRILSTQALAFLTMKVRSLTSPKLLLTAYYLISGSQVSTIGSTACNADKYVYTILEFVVMLLRCCVA